MPNALVRPAEQAPAEVGERVATSTMVVRGGLWRVLTRHRLLIAGTTILVVASTMLVTARMTPRYEAAASIRLEEEDEEQERPGDLRMPKAPKPSELPTELEILQSRALAEATVDSLGLQFALRDPARVPRAELFSAVHVARDATPGGYRLERGPGGRFTLRDRSSGKRIGPVEPGGPIGLPGVDLTLTPAAAQYPSIDFDVRAFDDAVEATRRALKIRRRQRDTDIMDVAYRGTDRQLVRDIPNALAQRFIAGLQSDRHAKARNTAAFLRGQIDKLSGQLKSAEDSLRTFREQQGVVNLPAEASTGVTQEADLEAKRNAFEAERSALAELAQSLQDSAPGKASNSALVYRNFIAFPSLLHDEAMSRLVTSISEVEDKRSELLTRRSLEDPDVQNLTARANELGDQLRGMALTYLRGLTDQVRALDSAIAHSRKQLERIPKNELRFARLQRDAKGYEDVVNQLQSRLKEAEIAEAVEDPSVQLVDAAILPHKPVSPKPLLNLAVALVLGALLGTSAAFVREHMDRTVRTRMDVVDATGVPILGLLPRARGPAWWMRSLQGAAGGGKHRLGGGGRILHASEALALAEGFNRLDTNLAFARPDEPPKVLAVTSPLPGEGKTTVAVNLAVTLAQRGARVLLIDADMRRGMVGKVFGVGREPGLSDVLLDAMEVRDVAHQMPVGGTGCLQVITGGRPQGNPAHLLGSPRARALIESLRQEFDSLVIDTPPANVVADAAVVGTQCDGVIVVARAGVTSGEALAFTMDQLEHVRAPVLGAVLNDIDFRRDAAYDDAYGYYADREAYTRPTS